MRLNKIFRWYFSKNAMPYWIVFTLDSIIVFLSGVFSYWLFEKTLGLFASRVAVFYTMLFIIGVSCIGFRVFKTYCGIIRLSSFVDLLRVAYANGLSLMIMLVLMFAIGDEEYYGVPALNKTEVCITFVIATMGMWLERIVIKTIYDVTASSEGALRILIYGAMSGSAGLAKSIRAQRPRKYVVCGFISSDSHSDVFRIMGLKVYYVKTDLGSIIEDKHITGVLVTPQRLQEFRRNQELQDMLIEKGVKILMAQNDKEMEMDENAEETQEYENLRIKEVSVEDLLPRSQIRLDMRAIEQELKGRKVLVTGAAGSIGSELVKQIAAFSPAQLILIDQGETPMHDIRLMMKKEYPHIDAVSVVSSICREDRMEYLFKEFRPEYVFHAAAYKHVPMMEDYPSEAVINNVYGTKVLADLSVRYGVRKFVMVSTDKAVNPTNVMGCSKRICEIYVQSLNHEQKTTQFVTTRFGNVLGSSGSVIPLFKEQIKKGGPVTVTDPRIVRFFMLIPEACKLVLEAGVKGQGGEIFAFDMGEPVKIVDLAKRMIALSKARNVEIKYTGLRPGEKLYEEVLSDQENTKPSFHEKIRIAQVREYDYKQVCEDLDELFDIAKSGSNMDIVRKMKDMVPEYKSMNSVYEELDKK